jgi:hypothetical protein
LNIEPQTKITNVVGYYIDLSKINLENYKEKLKADFLLPSRMILKERLDERFDYFKKLGLNNVLELLQLLKKKDKLTELLKMECFGGDYLVILLREINSIQPKPNKISEFTFLKPNIVSNLEKTGIKDTVALFDNVKTSQSRTELSKKANLNISEVIMLAKLTDLSRIKWVGTAFAWVLFEMGFDTVEKVANSNFEELYAKLNQLNKEKNLYKSQIGLNDMQRLVEAAKEVPLEIIFDEN